MNKNSFQDEKGKAKIQAIAEKGEIVKCEECGNDYFYPLFVLMRINKLEIGSKYDKVFPIQTYRCANCGHINRSINPLKTKIEEAI
jgi:uncharacterized Zn finger protein